MPTHQNRRVLLTQRPEGLPEADTWTHDTESITDVPRGHCLVEQHFISLDPAMRGWMRNVRSYIEPVGIGEVMRAGSVGRVLESNDGPFAVGQAVVGMGGVQQYALTDGGGWHPTPLPDGQLPLALGVLGMPGFTAYFGLLEIGKPEAGQTVLVSGAAGAVGSVVGQIARLRGCRVVGIAGGREKCAYLTDELGYDAAIDYKAGSVYRAIRAACPDGVDVYFDNVGGGVLDAALANLSRGARVVICGAISQYNQTKPEGPRNYMSLLVNRASMKGFVVFDFAQRYGEAAKEMSGWLAAGELHSREDVYRGIENFHDTFLRLFTGDKLGKLVLDVREEWGGGAEGPARPGAL